MCIESVEPSHSRGFILFICVADLHYMRLVDGDNTAALLYSVYGTSNTSSLCLQHTASEIQSKHIFLISKDEITCDERLSSVTVLKLGEHGPTISNKPIFLCILLSNLLNLSYLFSIGAIEMPVE